MYKIKEDYEDLYKVLNDLEFKTDEIGIIPTCLDYEETETRIEDLLYESPFSYIGGLKTIYNRERSLIEEEVNKIMECILKDEEKILLAKLHKFLINNKTEISNNNIINNSELKYDIKSILNFNEMWVEDDRVYYYGTRFEDMAKSYLCFASLSEDIETTVNLNIKKVPKILEKLKAEYDRIDKRKDVIDEMCDEETFLGSDLEDEKNEIKKAYLKEHPGSSFDDFIESEEYLEYSKLEESKEEHYNNADKLDILSTAHRKRLKEIEEAIEIVENVLSIHEGLKYSDQAYTHYINLYESRANFDIMWEHFIRDMLEEKILASKSFDLNEEDIPPIVTTFLPNANDESKNEIVTIMVNEISKGKETGDKPKVLKKAFILS